MCGILWAQNKSGNDVNKTIQKRYIKQRHRGREGFAFLTLGEGGRVEDLHRATGEKDILKKLKDSLSSYILFHHRLPTSTVNIPCATHPIVVKNDSLDYDYYVVHNGIINNAGVLRKTHEMLGYEYTTIIQNILTHEGGDGVLYTSETSESFNDSEALAVELARYIDGKSATIGARGSIAFICLQTDKNGNAVNLHYGRNSQNPLVVEDGTEIFCLKSEGHGVAVEPNILFTRSFATGETSEKEIDLDDYKSWYGYGGYNKPAPKDEWYKDADGVWRKRSEIAEEIHEAVEKERGAKDLGVDEAVIEDENSLWQDWELLDYEIQATRDDIALAEGTGQDTYELLEQLNDLAAEQEEIMDKLQALNAIGYGKV